MRTSTFRVMAACLALLALAAGAAAGLDLGIDAWTGNLGFRTDRASSDTSLPGTDYFWGISVFGSQPVTD